MRKNELHSFHIPVMGLGYTIDTPVKVARFGISSVISIIEDELIERMRKFHSFNSGSDYVAISKDEDDYRAKRITAYLNLVNRIVNQQTETLRQLPFDKGSEIVKYFELLPDTSELKKLFLDMIETRDDKLKVEKQERLRLAVTSGDIDVNIMAKADKTNYDNNNQPLPPEYSDALSALRGFARSELSSSLVLSAGYNPRLYSYIEKFSDFYPDHSGYLKKKIILKVSDFRSAHIQGKILAKKGLWVSEFRIESGLNCGGHAFATDGLLLGPILEEFRQKRQHLADELMLICNAALKARGITEFMSVPGMKVTVQGGIGTANENKFLLDYFGVNATGWGSPFLLVPEATNVDEVTLRQLATARKEDYYLSHASPLGIPFNNFRKSSSELQKNARIEKGRPGSPCYKKYLSFNTEFSAAPICTASRQYQKLKLEQIKQTINDADVAGKAVESVIEKECLCEGLGAAALLKNGMVPEHGLKAIAICPGPNLAYFSNSFSLQQMVDHIYGRINILNNLRRPNMFVNELSLYVDYLKNEIGKNLQSAVDNKNKQLITFQNNLLNGIAYYRSLIPKMRNETAEYLNQLLSDLDSFEHEVAAVEYA